MKTKKEDLYYVCELNFEKPDPRRPTISMHELDFYAYVPAVAIQKYSMHTHRLSIRKSMKTGQFEVYRFYPDNKTVFTVKDSARGMPFHMLGRKDIASVRQEGSAEEIVFSGTFDQALSVADNEDEKVWGSVFPDQPRMKHVPCEHEYPACSSICEKIRERYDSGQ